MKEKWVDCDLLYDFKPDKYGVKIYIADEADKEIERLKKEKEWLIEKLAEDYSDLVVPPRGKGTNKEKVILNMQQALKEG